MARTKDEKIELIDASTIEATESFYITPKLRWVIYNNEKILEQLWQGTQGTQRWESVPTVNFDNNEK